MDVFPKHKRNRAVYDPATQIQFFVFCVCRQLKSGRMVACDLCKEWFHEECVEIPS